MAKGEVVIKTKLESTELEKEYSKLQEKLNIALKEQEKINRETESYKDKLTNNIQKQQELEAKLESTKSRIDELNAREENGFALMKNETQELNNLNAQYERLVSQNEKLSFEYDGLNSKIEDQAVKYDKAASKVEDINSKMSELENKQDEINSQGLEGFTQSLNSIGSKIGNIVKTVGKWTLAVFGVRAAYSLVRQAVSTLSSYNDDLANKLESIKYSLAAVLEPIITRIVNWVYKLVQYIGYIAKAWFGIDIYAGSVASSTASAASSAKAMKKSLAGYDTANVLSDNSSGSSSSGSSGGSSIGIEPLADEDAPSWLQWIVANKDTVLSFFTALAVAMGAVAIAEFLSKIVNIGTAFGTLLSIGGSVLTVLSTMSALQLVVFFAGIATAIYGVITAIQGVIAFIQDPSWSNFSVILGGITVALLGAAVAMIAFNATNPVGWVILAVDAIALLATGVCALIGWLVEDKAEIKDVETAQNDLTEAIKATKDATNDYINAVDNAEAAEKALADAEKKTGLSGEELFNQVQKGTLDYKDMNDAQREVYKAYLNNLNAQETLTSATETLTEAKEAEKEASWENQLAIAKESDNYDDFKKSVVEAYENGELSAKEARTYIERACADMSKSAAEAFTEDIPDAINDGLDTRNFSSAGTKISDFFGDLWGGIKKGASSAWSGIKSLFGFSSGGVTVSSSTGFATGGVVKCASGSIINQPGTGVPISRAIGGEAGREGILPLTDSQTMATLGKEIGKWIAVNVDLSNYLDSRLIAKQMLKINSENSFAKNGG